MDVPDAAIATASEAASIPEWRARLALEAAAPVLAETIAQAILEHAGRQHPRDPDHVPTAWDRHFSIAARVAAGAFYSREDEMRLAVQAIRRGDFIACDLDEAAGSPPAGTAREDEGHA